MEKAPEYKPVTLDEKKQSFKIGMIEHNFFDVTVLNGMVIFKTDNGTTPSSLSLEVGKRYPFNLKDVLSLELTSENASFIYRLTNTVIQ